jgi:hypothetical protein
MLQYSLTTFCIWTYYWSVHSHKYLLRDYCTKLIDINHRYIVRPYKCNDCNAMIYIFTSYIPAYISAPYLHLFVFYNTQITNILFCSKNSYLSSSTLLGMEVCRPYWGYEILSVMNSEVSASYAPQSHVCAKHKLKLALVHLNCVYTVL